MTENFENRAFLIGRLESSFEFVYTHKKEKIYSSAMLITRKSGIVDRVPVTITESELSKIGDFPALDSYKFKVEGFLVTNPENILIGNRYEVSVRILKCSWEFNNTTDVNQLEVTGTICTTPKFRDTPKGRKICDFMVYVPSKNEGENAAIVHAIAWEKYAYLIRNLKTGNKITIMSRIQSRKYKKLMGIRGVEEKEVYEASVLSFSL